MTVEEVLRERWLELRNGAGPADQRIFGAVLDVLYDLGLLTSDLKALWRLRAAHECPGHDDEGGRGWCAYCGDMDGKGNPVRAALAVKP